MTFSPRPYQADASAFLQSHADAALFATMGLGKTASTLHALSELFLDGGCSGALVVAPLRVANLTWPAEAAQWFPWMRVANLRTKAGQDAMRRGDAHLYVCNYEMLPKLAAWVAKMKRAPWDTVVFDELTRAKNPSSARIKAIKPHVAALERRWGLTGTPTPNSFLELWGQIALLDGGKRLGKSFHQFKSAFFYPTDYMEYNWEPKPGAIDTILAKVSNMTLVQKASELLNLPDMRRSEIEVAMPDDARKQYDLFEDKLLLDLEAGLVTAQSAAVLAGKLLQMTGGHVYTDLADGRETVQLHRAKLAALVKLAKKTGPLLIATNYRHEQEAVSKAVPGCVRFETAKTIPQQMDLVDRWNSGKVKALVADPRSIGHGLNLQKGGTDIAWYSPTWSRELYDQFNARLHRSGQTSEVTIHHIICPGTIDDAVMETLRTRGQNQNQVLAVLKNLQALRAS
jgi:SNF2 family DNA or RNA helicase